MMVWKLDDGTRNRPTLGDGANMKYYPPDKVKVSTHDDAVIIKWRYQSKMIISVQDDGTVRDEGQWWEENWPDSGDWWSLQSFASVRMMYYDLQFNLNNSYLT